MQVKVVICSVMCSEDIGISPYWLLRHNSSAIDNQSVIPEKELLAHVEVPLCTSFVFGTFFLCLFDNVK